MPALQGEVKVLVEERTSEGTPFGRGRRVCMRFADVVRSASKGEAKWYLTAQHGSGVVGPPIAGALERDVPAKPSCVGALETESVSLWMGAGKEGSSSGMHHDFHDNVVSARVPAAFRGLSRRTTVLSGDCILHSAPVILGEREAVAVGRRARDASFGYPCLKAQRPRLRVELTKFVLALADAWPGRRDPADSAHGTSTASPCSSLPSLCALPGRAMMTLFWRTSGFRSPETNRGDPRSL